MKIKLNLPTPNYQKIRMQKEEYINMMKKNNNIDIRMYLIELNQLFPQFFKVFINQYSKDGEKDNLKGKTVYKDLEWRDRHSIATYKSFPDVFDWFEIDGYHRKFDYSTEDLMFYWIENRFRILWLNYGNNFVEASDDLLMLYIVLCNCIDFEKITNHDYNSFTDLFEDNDKYLDIEYNFYKTLENIIKERELTYDVRESNNKHLIPMDSEPKTSFIDFKFLESTNFQNSIQLVHKSSRRNKSYTNIKIIDLDENFLHCGFSSEELHEKYHDKPQIQIYPKGEGEHNPFDKNDPYYLNSNDYVFVELFSQWMPIENVSISKEERNICENIYVDIFLTILKKINEAYENTFSTELDDNEKIVLISDLINNYDIFSDDIYAINSNIEIKKAFKFAHFNSIIGTPNKMDLFIDSKEFKDEYILRVFSPETVGMLYWYYTKTKSKRCKELIIDIIHLQVNFLYSSKYLFSREVTEKKLEDIVSFIDDYKRIIEDDGIDMKLDARPSVDRIIELIAFFQTEFEFGSNYLPDYAWSKVKKYIDVQDTIFIKNDIAHEKLDYLIKTNSKLNYDEITAHVKSYEKIIDHGNNVLNHFIRLNKLAIFNEDLFFLSMLFPENDKIIDLNDEINDLLYNRSRKREYQRKVLENWSEKNIEHISKEAELVKRNKKQKSDIEKLDQLSKELLEQNKELDIKFKSITNELADMEKHSFQIQCDIAQVRKNISQAYVLLRDKNNVDDLLVGLALHRERISQLEVHDSEMKNVLESFNDIMTSRINLMVSNENDFEAVYSSIKKELMPKLSKIRKKIDTQIYPNLMNNKGIYRSLFDDSTKFEKIMDKAIITPIATAEYLYKIYIEKSNNPPFIDYSCIAAEYYMTFEAACNILLAYPYFDYINYKISKSYPSKSYSLKEIEEILTKYVGKNTTKRKNNKLVLKPATLGNYIYMFTYYNKNKDKKNKYDKNVEKAQIKFINSLFNATNEQISDLITSTHYLAPLRNDSAHGGNTLTADHVIFARHEILDDHEKNFTLKNEIYTIEEANEYDKNKQRSAVQYLINEYRNALNTLITFEMN